MIDETVEEIEQMQTHSSSVVAIKAAEALRALTDREFPALEEFERSLERNSNALKRANPSHATLQNTQRDIVENVTDGDPGTVTEAQEILETAIDRVIDTVENAKRRAAENGADLFEDSGTILTHDYSSTVLEALELAVDRGASLTVYVTEARPRYLGRKMARTLGGMDGVETHLLVDSAAGHFLPECDRVVVGMDCIVGETLYNRIGTYRCDGKRRRGSRLRHRSRIESHRDRIRLRERGPDTERGDARARRGIHGREPGLRRDADATPGGGRH